MPSSRQIADVLTITSGVYVTAEQITHNRDSGYAVTGLDRAEAHGVARAVLHAFEADLDAGYVEVRIAPPGAFGPGHGVRVTIDR